MKIRYLLLIVIPCAVGLQRSAAAQAAGRENQAATQTQAIEPARNRVQSQLQRALGEATRGEIDASLQIVRQTFDDQETIDSLNASDRQFIAPVLMQLSKRWESQQAPPQDVVSRLLEIVAPAAGNDTIRPYVAVWILPFDRLMASTDPQVMAPQSVSEQLVRWSIRAKQTELVRSRLKERMASAKTGWTARIVAIQLAAAEQDREEVNRLLEALVTEIRTVTIDSAESFAVVNCAVAAAAATKTTESLGIQLLDIAIDRALQSAPQNPNEALNLCWFKLQAARAYARAGQRDDAARLANAAVEMTLQETAEFPILTAHVRWMQRQLAAIVMLEAGQIPSALDILGPVAEVREPAAQMSLDRWNVAAILGRELNKLPAQDRLQLLRAWVIPNETHPNLREICDFIPVDLPPGLAADPIPRAGLARDMYSTGWHLLATARELGKLDQILQDLAAISQSTADVENLRLLGAVLRDGSADATSKTPPRSSETPSRLENLAQKIGQNLPQMNDRSPGTEFPMLALLVGSEAARCPEWRTATKSLLESLLVHTYRIQSDRPRAHVRMTWLELMRLRSVENAQMPARQAWHNSVPLHWQSVEIQSGQHHAAGTAPAVWYALEGYVQHWTSGFESDLVFEMPLAGHFEVQFETSAGGWMEGNAGYGAAQFRVNPFAEEAPLSGKGPSAVDPGPRLTRLVHKERWNRVTIQVAEDTVRYFLNGQLIHRHLLATSAPWLTLGADWGQNPIYRNLKVTGTPVIPRKVSLLADERLRGWITSHFGESRPDAIRPPRATQPPTEPLNPDRIRNLMGRNGTLAIADRPVDWTFDNGELTSTRHQRFLSRGNDSWIYYQRPLCDGDALHYEFFYVPGQIEASPTIGRLAYQFQNGKILRHYLDDGPSEVFEPTPDTAIPPAADVVLTENDWNAVDVTLKNHRLKIALNGQKVVDRLLNPTDNRMFGLHHDASRTSLRVRNATLTGDWPAEFTPALRAAIESPEPAAGMQDSKFLTYAINEERISDNAGEICRRALALDVAERYRILHQWVMPNSAHDLVRMSGAFTPTHPAPGRLGEFPIDVALAESAKRIDQKLVQAGGNYICPAILLAFAAAETGKLDELKQELIASSRPAAGPASIDRNTEAFLGILAVLNGGHAEAIDSLWECHRKVSSTEYPPEYTRWGDIALAYMAIHDPATCPAAYELLDCIQQKQLQNGWPGTATYSRMVRTLHDQACYLMSGGAAEDVATQPRTRQWRAVCQPSARSRGEGYPVASFDTFNGDLALRGGQDVDMAYFQSPLTGNYEITCRLTHFGFRELVLLAGGEAVGVNGNLKQIRSFHVRRPITLTAVTTQLTARARNGHETACDYKVVVKDGRCTRFINGQKFHESDLTGHYDPWVAVLGFAGNSSRYARNIVISGSPQVPHELDLLAPPDLKGWMTDYYGDSVSDEPNEWKLEDGVLISNQRPVPNDRAGTIKFENIIRYHRPMLEDGEIDYEFFYDPDAGLASTGPNPPFRAAGNAVAAPQSVKARTMVHPALDRMVCLLEPTGVRIHWLTDGRFDRTGLLPDNIQSVENQESQAAPLPLKVRSWNAVRLAVKGDVLTISLNGQQVFSQAIDATNLRHFGLFHYMNESSVRVRQVRYRGDWPKSLPKVDQQDLARGPERFADIPERDLPDSRAWDFTKSKFPVDDFSYYWDANAARQIMPTAAGLKFQLPAGESKPWCAAIIPKVTLQGDFAATIQYSGLKTVATGASWGSGLSAFVSLPSGNVSMELRQFVDSKTINSARHLHSPAKAFLYHAEAEPGFPESGRVRLVRRGPVMYYLVSTNDSPDFRLLSQRPVGQEDTSEFRIDAAAADDTAGAEFIVKSLTLRAAKIVKSQ